MKIKNWNIEAMTGYKPITTFYTDFSIADYFGERAIRDTYDRSFDIVKTDYKYLTEFVMVLNWKIWEHYKTNEKYGRLYDELWRKASCYASENLKGDELKYYYMTID